MKESNTIEKMSAFGTESVVSKETVEQIFGTLTDEEYKQMVDGWHSFMCNFDYYKDSIVVDMVKKWLVLERANK